MTNVKNVGSLFHYGCRHKSLTIFSLARVKGATSRYFELFVESLKIAVDWKETFIKKWIPRVDEHQRSNNKLNQKETRMVKDGEDSHGL